MITLQQLLAHLQDFLPATKLSDPSVNGLQIEGKEKIRKIAVAVTASYEAIEAAIQHKADALIVHHGILWNKDEPAIRNEKKTKIATLLKHDLSLIAYHLPLDAHPKVGNNWKAAADLGWKRCRPFLEIGVEGEIASQSPEKFQKTLENYYLHPAHVAPALKKGIRRVALISGGGWRFIRDAADAGIDAFVTGSFDEPAWHVAKERNIHFFALGHYATERIGVITLAQHLSRLFKIPCSFLDFKNPF